MKRVIAWEEPPESRGSEDMRAPRQFKPNPWLNVVEELTANPNRWGLILAGGSGQANALASQVRRGQGPWSPAGAFEAVSRKGPDGMSRVFARVVVPGRSEP